MRIDLRGPDAASLLIRAIRTHAAAANCPVHLVAIEGRPWASATFVGMRHRLTIAAPPVPHLRSWLDTVPEFDLPVRGHVVADIAIESIVPADDVIHVVIAVLTLIEG